MIYEGKVGPGVGADGSVDTIRLTKDYSQRVSDSHARYMEMVYRGNVWLAANQAGAAVTNLSTGATGFILSNPASSGKLLVLVEIGIVQTSTATTTANAGVQLAANVNPIASALCIPLRSLCATRCLGSSATGVGLADSSATLPAAPVAIMNLWQPSVSASATTAIPPVDHHPDRRQDRSSKARNCASRSPHYRRCRLPHTWCGKRYRVIA
jgi:hypothetical protein